MVDITLSLPRIMPSGEIVALDVAWEDYMARYAETRHEWVKGIVIKMSPVRWEHDKLTFYIRSLIDSYLEVTDMGETAGGPYVMRLPDVSREPDVLVILKTNESNVNATFLDGPADMAIEIVSPGSTKTDYGDKHEEYEAGGVKEYWLIDPRREVCHFYRMTADGSYTSVQPDADGNLRTPLLPKFVLHIPTLWREELPKSREINNAVDLMLKADEPG